MNSVAKLRSVAPLFLVADVVRASNYYRDVLGFSYDQIWGCPPCFCMAQRDCLTVMLQLADRVEMVSPVGKRMGDLTSWDAYIWVDDADLLFKEFQSRGVLVVYPPQNKEEYGNREFAVRDLDGYVIAFGSDIAEAAKGDSNK